MSDQRFDIVFRGDIVFGQNLQTVKARLQQLFKADAARIDALFTGRPVPLKRQLDEAAAAKYKAVLTQAGIEVQIVSSTEASATPVAPPPAIRPAGLSLAPLGVLLRPAERRQPVPVQVDVSGITLRPVGGNLLDSREQHHEVPAGVAVPEFDLAETGANLLRAEERPVQEILTIDLEDWDLADVGSDLLAPEERPQVVPAVVETADFGLAPVGSDLGQSKPEIPLMAPDTSHLSLAPAPQEKGSH